MPESPGRGLTVPKNPAAMLRALNARHVEPLPEENETDKQTNNTTNLQTDIPTTEREPGVETPTIQPTIKQRNKSTKKQTNNTTEAPPPIARRDGRTTRARQPASDPTATIVTSFRLSVATMEALDRFCFESRMRKQDVVERALAAFLEEEAGE